MKPEFESLPLEKKRRHFEMSVGDHRAIIVYEETLGVISLIHTEVDPELEGQGAGTAIVEKTLAYLEKNNFRLIPLCPMVFAYIKKHPEWKRIVDKDFKGFEESKG